jgi:type VI secretion system protein ImpF
MIKPLEDEPLRASILDRLENPTSIGRFAGRQTLDQLKNSVKNNLENLLNTRRRLTVWPEGLEELKQSLLTYGIPDFFGINMSTPEVRAALTKDIEETILYHEPRVLKVDVELTDNSERWDGTLKFRICVLLLASPEPEEVSFDTELDSQSRQIKVKRSEY